MKKKVEKKKITWKKYIGIVLFTITFIMVALSTWNVIQLDILPFKYFICFIALEILLSFLMIVFWKKKKVILIVIGIILMILLNSINFITNHYAEKTNKFIHKTFTKYITVETEYILITSKNNNINSIEELDNNQKIYYFKYSRSIDLALKKLGEHNFTEKDSISNALTEMDSNPNTYLLISKGDYEYLINSTIVYNKDNYKILYSFIVSYEEKVNDEIKDTYTIYLNGTDFTGIMRDFNLLVTINTKTKQILMTSILRGYYIDVPAYNMKDTLMCLGSLDSNVSKEAIEKLLDTKIDYTVNVNTNSLVKVVDTLGGVNFCSDYSFKTTHILTDNTYNDRYGTKLYVEKGCREYNGLEILAIARERVNLRNNERGRLDNCGQILRNIIKKSLTGTSLMNFEEVLNSYNGLYTTDMNQKVMKNLVKSFIESYDNYNILTQSLDGTDGTAIGHLGTQEVGVTFPDYNQVNRASQNIKEILKG